MSSPCCSDLKNVIDREIITHDDLVPIMKNLKQLEEHLLSALQTKDPDLSPTALQIA
ncbi:hypothetical protein V2O64_01210 [Verrucomicrobiaceae bacterium 227]